MTHQNPTPLELDLPLLTFAQELTATADELVVHNLRLARHFARRNIGRGVDTDDLEQEAVLALMHAATIWDTKRAAEDEVRFGSFAGEVIKLWLKRYIRNHGRSLRRPVWISEREAVFVRTENRLAQALERMPTHQEIADALGVPVHHVDAAYSGDASSLNATVFDPYEPLTLEGTIDSGEDTELEALARIDGAEIRRAIASLPNDLQRVIELLYPADGGAGATMRRISAELGMSYERTRQLREEALTLLREKLTKQLQSSERSARVSDFWVKLAAGQPVPASFCERDE